MLDQIVYTRCYPYCEISKNGSSLKGEGYGIFSYSENILNGYQNLNLSLLSHVIGAHNATNEIGDTKLISSYEYVYVDDTCSIMCFEYNRSALNPENDGNSSKMVHRGNNYVKQGYVGLIKEYPYQWFESSVWDAHKKSADSYYLNASTHETPKKLPQISEDIPVGTLTDQEVTDFIADGRVEFFEKILCFLMEQYEKPENQRKVLIVKDKSANIQKLMAAVERSLPLYLTRQISFSTNRIVSSNHPNTALFYTIDQNGSISDGYMATDEAGGNIHPYFGLVGIDPADSLSNSIGVFSDSRFVIADGSNKIFDVVSADKINRVFLNDAATFNPIIKSFHYLLQQMPLKTISTKIFDIYDGFNYLFNETNTLDQWNYNDTVKSITSIYQFGLINNKKINLVLYKKLSQIYNRFYPEDENNQYFLCQTVFNLANDVGVTQGIDTLICNHLITDLTTQNTHAVTFWNQVAVKQPSGILASALNQAFTDKNLAAVIGKMQKYTPEFADYALTLIYQWYFLMKKPLPKSGELQFNYFCSALYIMKDTPDLIKKWMSKIAEDKQEYYSISGTVAQMLGNTNVAESVHWWDICVNCSGIAADKFLYNLIDEKKVDIITLENNLANQLSSKKISKQDAVSLFSYALSKLAANNDSGKILFKELIALTGEKDRQDILSLMSKLDLSKDTKFYVFNKLDTQLLRDYNFSDKKFIEALDKYADSMGFASVTYALYALQKAVINQKKDEINVVLPGIVEEKLCIPDHFTESKFFASLSKNIIRYDFKEIEHLYMLLLFYSEKKEGDVNLYQENYIQNLLKYTRRDDLKELIVRLYMACTGSVKKIDGRTNSEIAASQRQALGYLAQAVTDNYYSRLPEDILDTDFKSEKLKKTVSEFAEKCGKNAKKKGIFGFFH